MSRLKSLDVSVLSTMSPVMSESGAGYTTAMEDSQMSLYYSINESMDKTLEAVNSSPKTPTQDDTLNAEQFIKTLQKEIMKSSAKKVDRNIVKKETDGSLMNSTPKYNLRTPRRDENFDIFVNIIKSVESKNKENVIIRSILKNDEPDQNEIDTVSNETYKENCEPVIDSALPISKIDKDHQCKALPSIAENNSVTSKYEKIMAPSFDPNIKRILSRKRMTRPSFVSTPLKVVLPNRRSLESSSGTTRPNSSKITIKSERTEGPTPSETRTSRKSIAPSVVTKNRFPLRKSIIPSKITAPPSTTTNTKFTNLSSRRSTISKTVNTGSSSNAASPVKLVGSFDCDVCKKKFRLESTLIHHKTTHEKPDNKCKYCNKTFALEPALNNHIINNCTKIPLPEKNRILAKNMAMAEAKKKQCDSKSSASSTNSSIADLIAATTRNYATKTLHAGVYAVPKKVLKCEKCDKLFFNIFEKQDHKKENKCRAK